MKNRFAKKAGKQALLEELDLGMEEEAPEEQSSFKENSFMCECMCFALN